MAVLLLSIVALLLLPSSELVLVSVKPLFASTDFASVELLALVSSVILLARVLLLLLAPADGAAAAANVELTLDGTMVDELSTDQEKDV